MAHAAAGGASLMVSGAQAPLVDGRAVASGSRIVTPPNGQATLSFSTGTTASLGPGADMSVQEDGGSQLLRLDGGSVDLHVAKLVAGQRFRVDTVDTEVEVRGTRFHVEVVDPATACAGGVVTRVAVSEGVVVVRHAGVEASVAAGDVWPKGCATAIGIAPEAGAGAGATHPRVARSPAEAPARASDLAGQNDLFAQGKAAWRRGDGAGALAAYDRLLARYPGGQLAEYAWVERMRVMRSIAPDRAPASAAARVPREVSGGVRAPGGGGARAGGRSVRAAWLAPMAVLVGACGTQELRFGLADAGSAAAAMEDSAAEAKPGRGGCSVDTDCVLPTLHCDTSSGQCVACVGDDQCGGNYPVCDTAPQPVRAVRRRRRLPRRSMRGDDSQVHLVVRRRGSLRARSGMRPGGRLHRLPWRQRLQQ